MVHPAGRLHAVLSHGHRRHFAVLRPAVDLADADLCGLGLAGDQNAGARIHGRVPGARDFHDRHVLRARSGDVLCFFRRRPDPDVPHHRRLGRGPPGLFGVQVLPLHVARLGADAAGHVRALLRRGHDGHCEIARIRQDQGFRSGLANLALARILRVVRGQDADVAGAHLAAGRPRRSAHGGLGHPRRRAAENGRLRVPALFAAAVPGCLDLFHAAGLRAQHRRDCLHVAGRAGARGYEKADRLFLGRAYGLCHARHFRRDLSNQGRRRCLASRRSRAQSSK